MRAGADVAFIIGACALSLAQAAPIRAPTCSDRYSLLSASPLQQADYARDPAISADGRYVVFNGSVGSVTRMCAKENRPGGELQAGRRRSGLAEPFLGERRRALHGSTSNEG